jgi:N-acyl-D-amino-acid deacylase
VLCVFDDGDDKLVHPFLAHDLYMMGTDGIYFPDGHVHPRMFGSAGRLLGACVRDWKLFSLETAVHRLAGFPARRFGLRRRGEIRVGNFADLVVFDADRVRDRATYEQPRVPVEGMDHVLVNGVPIVRHGAPVDVRGGRLPGRFLAWEGE